MDVDAVATGVEGNQVFLKLADTADCALQGLLYEDPLLRMNYLVVALLQISVDIDVFDIQAG